MKILYLSTHSVLEFDEISLFMEMGHEVFSHGAYWNPQSTGDNKRPSIPNGRYEEHLVSLALRYSKDHLHPELIDPFDVVIVMHIPEWITNNWELLKGKKVVWRSIGQSIKSIEEHITSYRNEGIKIVRMSPTERNIPGYAGEDAIIPFYKNEYEFGGWTGVNPTVINISQALFGSNTVKSRGDHMSLPFFQEVLQGFDWKVYGLDNEHAQEHFGGILSYEALKRVLQENRAFFYTGTQPSPYTLGFIEAWMTGIPIVAIGPKHANTIYKQNTWEIPDFIQNGVNGFYSDNAQELRDWIQLLINDSSVADNMSKAGRKSAIEHFGKDKIKAQWKAFFDTL